MNYPLRKQWTTEVAKGAAVAAGIFAATQAMADNSDASIVFGIPNEPRTLDPAYVYDAATVGILNQIYETLVQIEPGTANVVPGLASSYDVSEDGLSYTFNLREGVMFHDGTPFNADAVCYNFDRMYNFSGVQQTYSLSTFWQIIFGGFATQATESSPKTSLYESCSAPDEHTAIVTLTAPSSVVISALASRYFGIVSPAAIEKYGDDVEISGSSFNFPGTFGTEHPTGTGPFKFEGWTRGDKLSIARFDDYWGENAKVKRVIYRAIADGPARRQALESGEIDGYSAVAPQDINILKDAGYNVLERAPYNVGFAGFSPDHAPLDNVDIRKAISHALNRQVLVNAFFPEGTQVANQFLTKEIMGYSDSVPEYPYDPDEARRLIAQSGVENPTIEFWYPTGVSRGYMPDPKAIMETFKADMEKVGLTVVPKAVPWTPEYVAGIQRGKAPMYIVGRIGVYADPSDFLDSLFATGKRMATSPAIMEGLKTARTVVDPEERAAIYKDMNNQIMALAPGVPYASVPDFIVFKPGITGYVTSPVGQESMATVSVE